jgi:hypothetical protein
VGVFQQGMDFKRGPGRLHIRILFHGVGAGKTEPSSSRKSYLHHVAMQLVYKSCLNRNFCQIPTHPITQGRF